MATKFSAGCCCLFCDEDFASRFNGATLEITIAGVIAGTCASGCGTFNDTFLVSITDSSLCCAMGVYQFGTLPSADLCSVGRVTCRITGEYIDGSGVPRVEIMAATPEFFSGFSAIQWLASGAAARAALATLAAGGVASIPFSAHVQNFTIGQFLTAVLDCPTSPVTSADTTPACNGAASSCTIRLLT
jgi:hypothetical protein